MSFLTKAGRRWLRFAEILGNIQITIFLSLFYWTMFTLWAIPYKVLNDRLALRGPQRARWIQRVPGVNWLDSMGKQG
jgi:TRAP-type C4-dicarboxylate transport system permease small subunit